MNTIYNIYERLYNGILAPIDDNIEQGEENAKAVLRTYKEKLIKIVSLAGGLNDSESVVFRKMIDDAVKISGTTTTKCYMDKKLISGLIVCSGRQLTNDDFYGFAINTKEYNYQVNATHVYFDTICKPGFDVVQNEAKHNKGKFVYSDNNRVRCIYLGNNTYIFQDEGLLFIKVKNGFRLVVSITNAGLASDHGKFDLNTSLPK
jgi:hypothetical protein